MIDRSNILELEIAGIIVEKIHYFGRLNMYKQIDHFKEVYNLSPGDDYEFFYYKTVYISTVTKDQNGLKIDNWK